MVAWLSNLVFYIMILSNDTKITMVSGKIRRLAKKIYQSKAKLMAKQAANGRMGPESDDPSIK